MKPAYLIAGVLAVVAIIAVLILTGSQVSPPTTPAFHPVSNQSHEDLLFSMEIGRRLYTAYPGTVLWKRGEGGMFEVGVRNVMNETSPFYMNIYNAHDEVTGDPLVGDNLDVRFSNPGSLNPDESRIENVEVYTYPSTPAGKYLYMVVVCTQEPCENMKSDGLYATDSIMVDVE